MPASLGSAHPKKVGPSCAPLTANHCQVKVCSCSCRSRPNAMRPGKMGVCSPSGGQLWARPQFGRVDLRDIRRGWRPSSNTTLLVQQTVHTQFIHSLICLRDTFIPSFSSIPDRLVLVPVASLFSFTASPSFQLQSHIYRAQYRTCDFITNNKPTLEAVLELIPDI